MSIQQRNELAAELWKHHYENYSMNPDGTERSYCQCGAAVYPVKSLVQHQAEVALKHFEPRTIETVDELEALHESTILRSRGGDAFQQGEDFHQRKGWFMNGTVDPMTAEQVARFGPLTVLFEAKP